MSFNLAAILHESALADPQAAALRFGGTVASYSELDDESGRIAEGLRTAGLAPGEVVAVQLPNIPQFVSLYFGILKAGLVLLRLNPLLKAREIAYHLRDSRARILVTHETFLADAG